VPKPVTAKKPRLKAVPQDACIEDAMTTAYDDLDSLRDEVNEALDNQRDHPGISATERFSRLEDAGSNLDSIVDERPEWCISIPDALALEIRCVYTQDQRKTASRGDRAGNFVEIVCAAAGALRDWASEQRDLLDRIKEADDEPLTDSEKEDIAGRDAETIETQADEAEELAGIFEEHQATAEGLEFS
jgi:ElaB/YqjD/DUF883 family membrane-anchored ribosome-binding protein